MKNMKELLEEIKKYREGLCLNYKLLDEKPDERYPKSFIEGMMVGLQQAIGAIDATLTSCQEESIKKESP